MKAWLAAGIGVASALQRSQFGTYSTPTVMYENQIAPTATSACSEWTAWVPARVKPAVVVQVVTKDYLSVQQNFIELMEANTAFSRSNLYLLCLDEESTEAISTLGFRCVSPGGKQITNIHFIWKLRVKVVSCLLKAGFDLILSDSDALWIKDPMNDLNSPEARNSNIVTSRGLFPRDLGERWGATMCIGFSLFRSSASMKSFLNMMERIIFERGDDQIALNLAASELGIQWDTTSDMRYVSSTGYGRGTIPSLDGQDFNITLLPHSRYTRKCTNGLVEHETVVVHCRSKKNGLSKTTWMERAGLWVTKHNVSEPGYLNVSE